MRYLVAKKVHALSNNSTLCGKSVDSRWEVLYSVGGRNPITCPACKKVAEQEAE